MGGDLSPCMGESLGLCTLSGAEKFSGEHAVSVGSAARYGHKGSAIAGEGAQFMLGGIVPRVDA